MYVSYTPISFTRISMRMQCEYKLCNKDKQFKEKKKNDNIHTLSHLPTKRSYEYQTFFNNLYIQSWGGGGGGDTHMGYWG